ncbi:MAG: universal stress protein [Deltaproteobacteria bacterium]|jgi:nucleotide-binding universal stress UspA family protein|nr:universal stress protein [Deltaproteobacteria bacterium]MBK8234299.1 universal stress protein [Deltaproteobacteria bacterium]MBK8715023.1 universal stress protein [Deltaproteobacteria bacterium]MBP7287038.1 universal stress protein [Nannocystaceae bacterium]
MYRTILVALDGSQREPDVFRTAVSLAQKLGATLHACRAVTIPVGLPDAVWSMSMAQLDVALVEEAERGLTRRLADAEGLAVTKHVRMGQPADVVCDVAKEIAAELVVIGSHGYGTLERLLGTTASKIVHRCPANVLVVRSPQ